MNFQFDPHAERELKEATVYYDQIDPALADLFSLEVQHALLRIAQFPKAWPSISASARRCSLRKFPYGIVYRMGKDLIDIVAFMHLSRKPSYWSERKH